MFLLVNMDEPKPNYTGRSPYRLISQGDNPIDFPIFYSNMNERFKMGLPPTSLFGTPGSVDYLVHQALSENALTPASKARRAAQTHRAFGNEINRRAKGLAQLAIDYGRANGDTYEAVRERLRQAHDHYKQEIEQTVRAGILGYLEGLSVPFAHRVAARSEPKKENEVLIYSLLNRSSQNLQKH